MRDRTLDVNRHPGRPCGRSQRGASGARPPSPEIFASIAVEFGLISAALFFYWRGTIGAAFMSVAATLGAAVLWFAHVSPDAEQSVARIAANYTDPMARAVAAGIVYALMASLMATALYAASQVVAQGRKG
jgi:hypothetical protein